MQVFEFHFNPPRKNKLFSGKEDFVFDSFCFEPKNIYEKRIGNLYMAGFLKNILPQNARFLEILAEKIKEKYYKTASLTSEKSLKEALKTANEHLEKIAKQGDVSWLGNLSFSVISLTPRQKPWWSAELNFTKIGNFKIFLIRSGQIIDIDQKLKFDEIEPYPLKIFGNIVSGKLTEKDILLVLNKEIYKTFLEENLLNEIAEKPISEFSNIFKKKKRELSKISGICLLIALRKEIEIKEKETLAEKNLRVFSFKKFFKQIIKNLKIKNKLQKTKSIALPPKISFPKISQPISLKFSKNLKKKILPILILILILITGFLIFEKKEKENLKNYQIIIEQVRGKIDLANSYLITAEYNPLAEKKAEALYREAWKEIFFLGDAPPAITPHILNLKNSLSKKLSQLSKLKEILEPDLVFEFKTKGFVPKKLITFNDEIYLFSPDSEKIIKLNQQKEEKVIELGQNFDKAVLFDNLILFFSKPDKITILKNNQFKEAVQLKEPYSNFEFIDFFPYRSNLYFLENKNSSILKYPFISEANWGIPEIWLAPETKIAINCKSMAIDSSIWILTGENTLERYYSGSFQETIILEIFPEIKNFSKIFTTLQLPELYILEPEQKRIIIIDKSGQIIQQYQSEKFNNLLDFTISPDGKTIWLLNGLKVYQLKTD
jgi:hypothetical protein